MFTALGLSCWQGLTQDPHQPRNATRTFMEGREIRDKPQHPAALFGVPQSLICRLFHHDAASGLHVRSSAVDFTQFDSFGTSIKRARVLALLGEGLR